MTVCIAAICQSDRDPKIVLCTDWRQETYLARSDTADKLRTLPRGWVALIADTLNRAEELTALYESHLSDLKGFKDDAHLFSEIKKPAQEYKEILANEYISQTLGIGYQDFLNRAATLPDGFVTRRLEEVGAIKLGAALILAAFVAVTDPVTKKRESQPYLFVVDDQEGHQDVARVEDNFAVIGAGSYVAIPALNQREIDGTQSLMETIYAVYEAKRLAEIVPGVGESTSLEVLGPDGEMQSLSGEGHGRCKGLLRRLGPRLDLSGRKKSELFKFQKKFLEPFDKDEAAQKPHERKSKKAKKPRKFFGVDKPLPGERLE